MTKKTPKRAALKVETVTLAGLELDPRNARRHPDRNLESIKASLTRFGQQKPIVVDADGVVVAGNGTFAAATALNWKSIHVVRTKLRASRPVPSRSPTTAPRNTRSVTLRSCSGRWSKSAAPRSRWEDGRFCGVVLFGMGSSGDLGKKWGLGLFECCEMVRLALGPHESPVSRVVSVARGPGGAG